MPGAHDGRNLDQNAVMVHLKRSIPGLLQTVNHWHHRMVLFSNADCGNIEKKTTPALDSAHIRTDLPG